MKNSFPQTFCIIDVETTGLRAAFSRIIDIAIIRVENGVVRKKYQTLLNPQVSLPYKITQITGIKDEDLYDAPLFEDVALEIQELLKDAVFVAHNVTFDYSFVQKEFTRLGITYNAPKLCSVNLSRTLYPKEREHNLDALIERFDIRMKNRHRAMPDAEAVLAFFKHVSKNMADDEIQNAITSILDTGSPRTSMTQLPESSGVYFFYGKEQELLYIGKSKNIRTRVRSHFHATPKGKGRILQHETGLIDTVRTSGELSALLLESSLIKRESPIFNKLLVKRKTLVVVRRSTDKNGYHQLLIEHVNTINPDDDVVSVFRTTQAAKKKMEEICLQHNLCSKLSSLETTNGACFNYQLRKCNGACIGLEEPEMYNERVEHAFHKRKLRVWPYKGIVRITERGPDGTGTVLFIDNWLLKSSFTFDGEGYRTFLTPLASFDYDTYKILVRYMLDQKNKSTIEVISHKEYTKDIETLSNTFENELIID